MSCITITHRETDVEPECKVEFWAGRLDVNKRTDTRIVEIVFKLCYYARVGPHSDSDSIEALGYVVDLPSTCASTDYIGWRARHWRETGNCPDSGF
jgi:hypothetical protein